MIDKELVSAISDMGEEEGISFIAWKIAEQEAGSAENKAALARLNAEFAKQLYFEKRHLKERL